MNAPITSALLHQRLVASLKADTDTVAIDSAVETAIRDLRRIERGIIWGRNPPSEFTMRKLDAIASHLLQATMAYRLANELVLSHDL